MGDNSFDPDLKIHMSLDEIINLTKPALPNKNFKGIRRKRYHRKKKNFSNLSTTDHSIPLLSSLGGGYIYVTKNSPLLSAANKREIVTAVSNRALNQDLIKKNKEIIPASYKLVKTATGVERVLVPVEEHEKEKILNNTNKTRPRPVNNCQLKEVTDRPPPLIEAPSYKYINGNVPKNQNTIKMEVDEDSGDEVLILNIVPKKEKSTSAVIDVESGSRINVPQSPAVNSLHDRFTRLCGSFQF